MPNAEQIESVVRRYLDLVATGTAEDIAGLYADDATLQDPVGGESHIGRHAILGFYQAIEGASRETELRELRVAGHEAAFLFAITVGSGEHRVRIEPIDVMVINEEGRIASMKAYWSPGDVTPL